MKKHISPADFKDQYIICCDCGDEFLFTAGEQAYYTALQLTIPPKRCKPCREVRKNRLVVIESQKDGGDNG